MPKTSKKPRVKTAHKIVLLTLAISLVPIGVLFTNMSFMSRWNLVGDYVFEAKCVAPCQDLLTSNVKITAHDLKTGNYLGTSQLTGAVANATIFGNLRNSKFTISIKVDPAYANIEFNGEGRLDRQGHLMGQYTDGTRTYNFKSISGAAKRVDRYGDRCDSKGKFFDFRKKDCDPNEDSD